MEDGYFGGAHASLGWQNPDKTAAAAAALQANCAAAGGQLQPFLTLNWNQQHQVDQGGGGGSTAGIAHFQSPLAASGAAAPPAPHLLPPAASVASDSAAFRELIGRLSSGEISQWTTSFAANATACFGTPPPQQSFPQPHLPHNPALTSASPQLSSLAVDPAFVERAARFSSFCGGLPGQFPLPDVLKLSAAVPISPTPRTGGGGSPLGAAENNEISVLSRSSTPDDGEFIRGVRDDSPSASEHKFSHSNSKKRKADASSLAPQPATSRIPLKAVAEEDLSAKRMKSTDAKDDLNPKIEGNGEANSSGDTGCRKHGKENNSKATEPPKDYIHVRARRGQATDSHSLAERVRREKISQRMKFLQDLVPGCNKVTGKAVMLDEIINYVQSLQRQVEFLSMKLATVNPQMDFNVNTLLQKDMYQPRGSVFQMESSSLPFPFAQPPPQDAHLHQNVVTSGMENHLMNPMDSTLKRPLNGGVQLPALDGFGGTPPSRVGSFMEDDLHSVVQMGLGQAQEDSFSSQQPFHQGSASTPDSMKLKF